MSIAGDAGTVATAVATAGGLLYAGRQIRLTRNIARRDMAYRYMDRLNDREFAPILGDARAFWDVPTAEERAERWARWADMSKAERLRIVLPLNIFEEMATMYLAKIVDPEAVDALLGSIALDYWEEAEWFILKLREGEKRVLLIDWERMNEDLRRRRARPGAYWPPVGGLWGRGFA